MIITPKIEEQTLSLREWVAEQYPEAIIVNGYDHCIVGLTPKGAVIYSADNIIKTLVAKEHDWDYEDAIEWFDYNIAGSFVGDNESHPKFMFNSESWMLQ